MHHGVYVGAAFAAQAKKILILGESHHGEEGQGKRGNYATREVVEAYLSQKDATEQSLQFFHKIARSFGIDSRKDEEKRFFWDKVCFGNYVDVICGIGDGAAKKQIEENRDLYNQELAEFVNEHQIDAIFCFSVLVYWALPTAGGDRPGVLPDGPKAPIHQKVVGSRNGQNVYLRGYTCESMPGLFDHPVTIYGVPHPSAQGGFDPKYFAEYLKPIFDCRG